MINNYLNKSSDIFVYLKKIKLSILTLLKLLNNTFTLKCT